jgi:hypothetical protein
MNAMDEKKAAEPTAEQLLKLLDMQLAESRQRRSVTSGRRTTFRIFSVLVLVLGTVAAVGLLLYLLEDLRSGRAVEDAAVELR